MQRLVKLIVLLCFLIPSTPPVSATTGKDLTDLSVLDLATAQRIALADHPSAAAAEERIHQACEQVRQAKAAWWPTADATVSGARTDLSDREWEKQGRPDNPEDEFRTGLQAEWILFDGFKRNFDVASARKGEQAERAAGLDVNRQLLATVADYYYSVLLARENKAVAEANLEFYRGQADEARARHRAGAGSLSDALSLEIRYNSGQVQVIRATLEHEASRFGLAAIMGIADVQLPDGLILAELEPESHNELIMPDAGPLLAYALDHRPDIRQLHDRLDQARHQVGIAGSRFYPVVRLDASITGNRPDDPGFGNEDMGNSVGVYLTYNLFSGGQHKARLREANSRVSEVQHQLGMRQIEVAEEVRKSLAQLTSAKDRLHLQRANRVLAQKNRDLVEKAYAAGQESLVRLNEAQLDFVTSGRNLAKALVALRLAWEELKSATNKQDLP